MTFRKMLRTSTCLALVAGLTACAGAGTGISSQQTSSADGRYAATQFTAIPPSGQTQNVMMVWDNALGSYAIRMGSESVKFSEALMRDVVGALPALISGLAAIEVADRSTCGRNEVCGTVIMNDGSNNAYSESGAKSGANVGVDISQGGRRGHKSSRSATVVPQTIHGVISNDGERVVIHFGS